MKLPRNIQNQIKKSLKEDGQLDFDGLFRIQVIKLKPFSYFNVSANRKVKTKPTRLSVKATKTLKEWLESSPQA